MNLILSDRELRIFQVPYPDTKYINVSQLKIANCIGCFGCWTKTPGRCVIRDDAVGVYPLIAASRRILHITRIRYGGYDTPMKTMLERSIPVQQAFLRLLDGETHHIQRNVVPKEAVLLGYGDISAEEREIFCQLAERNAKNMCFQNYKVVFTTEEELEQTVRKEVERWGK